MALAYHRATAVPRMKIRSENDAVYPFADTMRIPLP